MEGGKKRRHENVDLVDVDPEDLENGKELEREVNPEGLENGKELEREAQGAQGLNNNSGEGGPPLSRLIRGFRSKYH